MSGGSFNYLCTKSAGQLIDASSEDLRHMAEELGALGYADDAANATQEVIDFIRATEKQVETMIDRLNRVWREMEWWQSGDTGEYALKRALEEFRALDP